MSALSEIVTITITADTVGVAVSGFGIPLVVSHTAAWTERTRTYTSLADVAVDFSNTSSPEYLAADAIFSQSPHPEQMMIGRASLLPTQTYVIGVKTVANAQAYSLNVVAPGATIANPYTFTSSGSATNDNIVAGLVTTLNAIVGKNFTAAATGTVGSQVCTVTGNAAGDWFSLEVVDINFLTSSQTHADPGIATDLAAILTESDAWYALNTTFNSKAYVLAAAAWVEANGKIYLVDVTDTDAVNVAVGSSPTDTLYELFLLSYNRTAGSYYPSPARMFSSAWLGRVLPDDPGTETWKFKTLAGVTPVTLTATQRTNLKARKANSYTTIAGVNITWDGTVAGGTYGFIDVTRGLDWLTNDMESRIATVLMGSEKIPYTDPGIAIIRAEVKSSLKEAAARGIIDDTYTVSVPKAASVSASDKAARKLTNVKFTGVLQGAIHTVSLSGVVSV